VKYLEDLRAVVTQSDVSPFEIHHSGLVDSLLTFLTSDDDFDTDNVGLGVNVVKSDGGELTKKRRLNRQKRLQLFCEIFLNIKVGLDGLYNGSLQTRLIFTPTFSLHKHSGGRLRLTV